MHLCVYACTQAGPSGRHQTLEPLPASRQSSSGALLPNSPLANRARKHLMAIQAEISRARVSDPGMLSPRDRDTHTDTGGSSSQHAAFLDSPDLGSAQVSEETHTRHPLTHAHTAHRRHSQHEAGTGTNQ